MLATDPDRAVRMAGLIDVVRGYEGVKMRNVETYRAALDDVRAGREPAGPPARTNLR